MRWVQKEIVLPAFSRGYHVVTNLIKKELEELKKINVGVLYIFIKHTSASLTINEDIDPTVRIDFESHMNQIVPENASYYKHIMEGEDDMPAHLKSSLLGSSLIIPITKGKLNLGTWQGIYLCEHRNNGGCRKILITLNGQ
tara:strand:+ start:196 stop:618 length:423 start_codon:yes stop_codon:yes gene_type:complete